MPISAESRPSLREFWRTTTAIFRGDGLQLLRDRRTLAMTVVLPALLYPVLMLVVLQVMQLTAPTAAQLPQVAVLGADDLYHFLSEERKRVKPPALPAYALADPMVAKNLSEEIAEPSAEAIADPAWRASALALIRRENCMTAILVGEADALGRRPVWRLSDQADRYAMQVGPRLDDSLRRWATSERRRLLSEHGADPELADAIIVRSLDLAPTAQALRSQLAGILPLMLLLMAISGAFVPAVDLIAGERERGTLEPLLASPADRRGLIAGKLAVVIAAALASVLVNLLSIGATALIAVQAGGLGSELVSELLPTGLSALAISAVLLLPITIGVSAAALAVAGLCASVKEAQNALSPLILVCIVPAASVMAPNARPSIMLDLIPIVGPLLALKESLIAPRLPWLHLMVAGAASVVQATIIIGWCLRRFEDEHFCYPQLGRAGWGRFRRWGRGPALPGPTEVVISFAAVVAVFLGLSALLRDAPALAQVVLPIAIATAALPLLHCWLGRYSPRRALLLALPNSGAWLRAGLLVPLAILLSMTLGQLQWYLLGPAPEDTTGGIQRIIDSLNALGGLPLLVFALAVVPGICEELCFRGLLLTGLRRGTDVVTAIALSAILFAVLHASPWRFLPQATLGVVLALLTLRCGSVLPAMLVHLGHNAVLVILAVSIDQPAGEQTPEHSAGFLALIAGLTLLVCLIIAGRARSGRQGLVRGDDDQTYAP